MRTRILTAFFLFCLISNQSIACDCRDSKDLKEIQNREFTNSKYIFIGEISKIDTKKHTFEVKVIESFKGAKNGKVYRGVYDKLCGPIIDEVGTWLIYGTLSSGNTIKVNVCGLTRSFKNPEHIISATKPPKPLPSNASKSQIEKESIAWKERAKADLAKEIADLRKRCK
ncbi:hypothetical protein [Flavobacterium sp. RSSB_23]|uniref:hypothetical protein n=1 Tax=Flavobacterium sp. RSSB_23 TaxID=3447668 RepID=UPI003F2CCA89